MARDGAVLPMLAADGKPAPEWSIAPRLSVPTWATLVIAAFWDLSTERALGFGGVGPIPWSRIVERGSLPRPLGAGLSGDDLATFVAAVRACDGAYLRHEKQTADLEAKKGRAEP